MSDPPPAPPAPPLPSIAPAPSLPSIAPAPSLPSIPPCDTESPQAPDPPHAGEIGDPGRKDVYQTIGIYHRHQKEPIWKAVRDVWTPRWANTSHTWSELPEQEKQEGEAELQAMLEEKYPADTEIGNNIRRCHGWLAWRLLSEKHRMRRRGRAQERAQE